MTGVSDLERLEREAFRRFYDDGLFDVFLGVLLGLMPLGAWLGTRVDSEAVVLLILVCTYGVLTVGLLVVRRHLLRTRLGEFTPGPSRRRKIHATRMVLLGSVLVGVVAFIVAAMAVAGDESVEIPDLALPVLWFVNATVVFGAMAYFLDVPRFAVHGVLFGSALFIVEAPAAIWDVEVSPWIGFGIPAVIVASVGLWKLIHFLRTYPHPAAGADADAA